MKYPHLIFIIIIVVAIAYINLNDVIEGNKIESVIDAIPTENVPNLKLSGKDDLSDHYRKIYGDHIQNVTIFIYGHTNEEGSYATTIKLYEYSVFMYSPLMPGSESNVTVENITVDGFKIRHYQKIHYDENYTEPLAIYDIYSISLPDYLKAIEIVSIEYPYLFQGKYDDYGLTLAKIIIKNLKEARMI